jgi:hypothetical protein
MMQLQVNRQLQLEKGIAQITYFNGAVVLIEGPAFFTVDSPKSGFLSRGKLTARADTEQSRQFSIVTPDARFVDLGTEFGVKIDEKGRAAVAVFAGKVNAEAKLADGRWTAPISLRKGEAVVCEGNKFTPQVAQRSNFPTLQPLPPLPPNLLYQSWLEASQELQKRSDIVAYFDFQRDDNNPNVLINRASTGAAFNGQIKKATWTKGRFEGKSALKFAAVDSGVLVNLPKKYEQMTLVTWVKISELNNFWNGILLSNDWSRSGQLHWEIQSNAHIILNLMNQNLDKDTYYSTKPIPSDCLNRWSMITAVIYRANQRCLMYLNDICVLYQQSEVQIPSIEIGAATIAGWLESGKDSDTRKTRNLSCCMDSFMIFQSALSENDIKQIYEASKP